MYQYFKGYIIREGAEGLNSKTIKRMYEEAGWITSGPLHNMGGRPLRPSANV